MATKTVKEAAVEKKTAVKAAEKKAVEKKATDKKVTEKKAVTKKAPAKKAVVKENVVIQFGGKETTTTDIMKNVKAYWTKELKNKVGDLKSVTLYVKPEENKVYFVINNDVTGSVDL